MIIFRGLFHVSVVVMTFSISKDFEPNAIPPTIECDHIVVEILCWYIEISAPSVNKSLTTTITWITLISDHDIVEEWEILNTHDDETIPLLVETITQFAYRCLLVKCTSCRTQMCVLSQQIPLYGLGKPHTAVFDTILFEKPNQSNATERTWWEPDMLYESNALNCNYYNQRFLLHDRYHYLNQSGIESHCFSITNQLYFKKMFDDINYQSLISTTTTTTTTTTTVPLITKLLHVNQQPHPPIIIPSNILCYNQQYLQQMMYFSSPKRYYTEVPTITSSTHNKLVKPQVTLRPPLFKSNLNLNFSYIFTNKFEFHLNFNSIRSIISVLIYCVLIVASLYSIKTSTLPFCSLVEKSILISSSLSPTPPTHSPEIRAMSELRSLKYMKPHNTDMLVYTAPKFEDGHNHMLSLALQQQLDAMSPREYLPYVLKELTLDERESLMIDEAQRRKTFLVNWPLDKNLSGIQMAKAGFYALDDYDRVQCVFCRGSLHKWDPEDIPINEHQKSFPFCRFVKGMECGNREYRSKKLTDDDMKNITKFGPPSKSSRDGAADNVSLGISTNRAATVQYAPDATRLKTFSRWPTHIPVKAKDLCEAGFYYTGFDDQVRCFFCAGGLREWVDGDVAWEEHARWFPECLYLMHQKGQTFIDAVHDRTPDNKKSARKTHSQKKVEAQNKEHVTMQEEMFRICTKLGHEENLIRNVAAKRKKPFENISQLLDAVYQAEDSETGTDVPTEKLIAESKGVCPDDEHQRALDEVDHIQPGRFDGSELVHKYELGCWNCEARANNFTQASHIGLPCGHLIFCDKCNTQQARKSKDPQHKVICPYKHCGATLSASMRAYFA